MKNQKKQCKIVYDLLPNYVDKLTSEETNEYIQEHIEKCPECLKTLEDMQGEIELEKDDKNVGINAFKKVKRRIRLQILISIISVIWMFSIAIYINNNYSFYRNEEGKISIKSYKTNITVSNSRYLIIKGKRLRENTEDGYVYRTNIATINEKDICTNMRCIENGYAEKEINDIYKSLVATEYMNVSTNIELKDNKLYYNDNMYNGKNINDIIDELKNYYNEIESIEEM